MTRSCSSSDRLTNSFQILTYKELQKEVRSGAFTINPGVLNLRWGIGLPLWAKNHDLAFAQDKKEKCILLNQNPLWDKGQNRWTLVLLKSNIFFGTCGIFHCNNSFSQCGMGQKACMSCPVAYRPYKKVPLSPRKKCIKQHTFIFSAFVKSEANTLVLLLTKSLMSSSSISS